uniref:ribonuclease H n=1 Tax=Pelodiscus sinensis TaxID=13735 RepID=K7G546_PELSI
MDIVGPLEKSARGHQSILVVVDYATRYPEAVPLRNTLSKTIAKELIQIFSRVGIPKEILTDQGTPFVSKLMKDLCTLLRIRALRTSVYHPQTDGLVERFNRTLKSMLKKVVSRDGKDWDMLLPYLMFAVREVPQASTGFSPFELLYGRNPRGILDLAKEAWEEQPNLGRNVVYHVRDRIARVTPIVWEHLEKAQEAQQVYYNRRATARKFQVGDRVMVLVPMVESKLLAQLQGPYEIIEAVGEVNYKVRQSGWRKPEQVYHVNLLKLWRDREVALVVLGPPPQGENPSRQVGISPELTPDKQAEAADLIEQNQDVFSTEPGRTTEVYHDIITDPGVKVHVKPYRIPEAKRKEVQAEVEKMLKLGVIEESHSQWSSPIVMVPKPDGSRRFCNDFRKLNEVSKFDAYPMPRVDELIDQLGKARFLSTLDLTKGYWQIPLAPGAKEKTAFSTPEGLFQYTVLPFGLHGAPATFQRLMDKLLRPHAKYAAAYLDDVVVHSPNWDTHIEKVEAVLETLRRAGLTANPAKCTIGLAEAKYLGYIVGRGVVRPQLNKVDAIQNWPRPTRKKQVRAFLGLVGYYRRFIPNFASRACPLTNLTRARGPDIVKWTMETEEAFKDLKNALCGNPVLIAPDFKKEFILQTDASEVGLGAVLSQMVGEEEHPILYLSRKLLPREQNYAVVERECLAVKWAMESLRYYLLGRKFTLVTDHAPLQWMHRNKDRNARVTRRFLSLQPFRFLVQH